MEEKIKENKNKKPGTKGIIKRIFRENKSAVYPMIGLSIFSALSVTISILGPYFLGVATDELHNWWMALRNGTPRDMNFSLINTNLKYYLILVCISALVSIFISVVMNNITSRRFTYGHRVRISDKLSRTPVRYIDATPHGEILSRMLDDVSELGTTMHNVMITLLNSIIQVIGIGIIMFWLNPIMAGIVVLILPLNLLIASKISVKCEKEFISSKTKFGELNAHIQESYSSHSVIKAFGLEEKSLNKYKDINNEVYKSSKRAYFYATLIQPVIGLISNFTYVILIIVGALLVINSSTNVIPYDVFKLSVGEITSLVMYAMLITQPITQTAYIMGQFQRAKVSVSRVYEVLDAEEMKPDAQPGQIQEVEGNITFENVNFSYDEKVPLIQDLNINIKSGQRVAIVGPTGAGKTTLVNLLMRFYDLNSGVIRLDGKDITQIAREDVRNVFGMVLQDTWLFSGTIYDNIAYGAKNATPEDVKKAAIAARADNFILTLPKGYDTEINEDASNISQGQKQLITIARAFLADSQILILDEATSNVDTRTEVLIQKAMDELMHNKTCFIIAHRLSTIVNADIILVMNEGKVVETGSHKELLARGGFYSELYKSQYSSLEN
ncbi:MAG TPA: ABC transporter ATP-binding protein [Clostridia bacterium]